MLPDHCHRRIDVASAADAVAVRDLAAALAESVLSAADAERLDAMVGALAGHVLARSGGMLLLRRWGRREGVECLACDRDTGADASPDSDGVTLARACADRFAAHATPGVGLTILARVLRPGCSDEPAVGAPAIAGVAMLPKPGAAACADGWVLRSTAGADGTGSGVALLVDGAEGAGALARRAEAVVAATAPGLSPQMVIGAIRRDAGEGADVTAAVLRFDADSVDYTALGTVAGAVVRRHHVTSLAARWAMVGYNPQMPASVHLLWQPGDHVVLHSDGCARLPVLFIERGLHDVDPTLAAAVLLRDGATQDDDRTVIVLRNIAGAVQRD
ncbi:hypothetical protein J2847_005539 [Azospirillum agricola]|uniref:hypothetical protein n=1 Tax=Azospirillum agricola TaxID=1720247 RepID=UPI001AE90ADE|nr:hypothetical protein [Azospirillum agricola]MBP2232214.1 hypothetical protein [Azospirillum agricola]